MTFNASLIDNQLKEIYKTNRTSLMESEVYQLLQAAGMPRIPVHQLVKNPDEISSEFINQFPGHKVVLKVVSPYILHKSDAGGVKIINKTVRDVQDTLRKMLETIPEAYLDWAERSQVALPEKYATVEKSARAAAVRDDIDGILITEFVSPEQTGFGYEMLLGLRWSREFGPVLTAGLGGIDTELYAKEMKAGLASISASAEQTTQECFLDVFKTTLAYRKTAGLTRAGRRVIGDAELMSCFHALLQLARHMGPKGTCPFVIEEMEVNPFVFAEGQAIPLDGLFNFSLRRTAKPEPPVDKIRNLLHPASMAVIGVSASKMNMGRIILRNIIKNKFPMDRLYVIRPNQDELDGVRCVPSVSDLPEKTDVLVLAIDASQAPTVINDAAQSGKVESVIIIPGGLGEKSGTEEIVKNMNTAIAESRLKPDRGPVFVGGNCLGILSRPGPYDTLFVPEEKLPKNYDREPDPVAFLTQSGARMITVMSQQSYLTPQYAISTGNQMDLGISDFLEYMTENEPQISVFAVYVEGFKNLGGLRLIKSVKKLIAQNRNVIFYKAGRTPAGKTATSGHTASVAGDYSVCAQLLEQAGAIVCDNFTEFNELTRLAAALHGKTITGTRMAGISNAGYETVGMADNIGGKFGISLAKYSDETRNRIQTILEKGRIDTLVDIRNPMDVTPMGNDAVHEGILQAQLDDPGVDCVIAATIPITPAQNTLPAGIFGKEDITRSDSYAGRIIKLFHATTKPMICVIDSGIVYDPLVRMMSQAGMPVFRTADLALQIFGKYLHTKLKNC